MTKITLTWQKDENHQKPFEEVVELSEEEISAKIAIGQAVDSIISGDSVNPFTFERATRVAAALALDNCADQLLIIRALVNEPLGESCHQLHQYKTLKEKFAVTRKARKRQEEEEYEKIPYTDLQKLRDDICFVCTTLTETSKELQAKGLFTTLLTVIISTKQEEEDSRKFETAHQQRLANLKDLKWTFIKEKQELEKELQEANDRIFNLQMFFEDTLGHGKEELRYIDKWENARQYQNDLVLNESEDKYNNCIIEHKTKIELENRIHGEIENFILENTEDLQNEILFWMAHYDEEIERKDSDIIRLKDEWEVLTEAHTKLQETYVFHRIEIEEWLIYKEEMRKREEYELLCNRAAIKLQAWWRGTMVRKKLGRFRKKKPKKDKKGKVKGKGKKK